MLAAWSPVATTTTKLRPVGNTKLAQFDGYSVPRISQTTTILKTNKPASEMTMFSSMRPKIITPDIIKPDITRPWVNVLATWSPIATTTTKLRPVGNTKLAQFDGVSVSSAYGDEKAYTDDLDLTWRLMQNNFL
ncbi:hypothetical protein ACLB2K_030046 [Fragaria x ananassa]